MTVEAVRELGLNGSQFPTQYVTYVTGLLKSQDNPFAHRLISYKGRLRKIRKYRSSGILLHCCKVRLWVCSLKCVVRNSQGKWRDYTGMTIAVSGISLPLVLGCFFAVMLFAVKLRILPTTNGTGLKERILVHTVYYTLGVGIAAVIPHDLQDPPLRCSRDYARK